jgi:anti-anti-sigma factor
MANTVPAFRVGTDVEERAALVSLFGELDQRVADYCEDELSDVEMRLGRVDLRLRHGIVDLRGLTLIDRIGVHTLVRAHTRSRMGGWKLTVVRGPPRVDEAFTPLYRGAL